MRLFGNFRCVRIFKVAFLGLILGILFRLGYVGFSPDYPSVSLSPLVQLQPENIFQKPFITSKPGVNPSPNKSSASANSNDEGFSEILGFDLNPAQAFSPTLSELVSKIDAGCPTRLVTKTSQGRFDYQIAWRPVSILADNFRYTLGDELQAEWGTRTYQGIRLIDDKVITDHTEVYSLAVVQNALFANITHSDGSQTLIRSSENGGFESVYHSHDRFHYICEKESNSSLCLMRAMGRTQTSDLWEVAGEAEILVDGLTVAEQGGYNPQNGKLEKYVQTIPSGDMYFRSLRPMLMLAVLDKKATGGRSESLLQNKTSQWLAMISNVASVYENQLGIRLLLQELVLTPTSNDFNDIPQSLDQFRAWCNQYRRQSLHGWSSAVKWGNGLSGNSLGVAFLRSIQGASSVAIIRENTGWPTLAHEMGHNLGSEHSDGGIMNSFANGDGGRNFFTDVQNGVTSAFSIYSHSRNRLPGERLLRNPREIPFAKNDSAETEVGKPVTIPVLNNDLTSVRHGEVNRLSIAEVSKVSPQNAGEVAIDGANIIFTPSLTFGGTAFFSYSLQGDVGNSDSGWLHKGDVAVVVGKPTSVDSWTLAPGESISFDGKRNGSISFVKRPNMSIVHVSKDDDSLIVVRANRNAKGSEVFQYRQGGANFSVRIIYQETKSTTVNDIIVWDKSMGSVTLNPLSNDYLAGRQSLQHLNLTYGVGSPGNTQTGIGDIGWGSRIVLFRNMNSGKGIMEVETIKSSYKGVARNNFYTGSVTFTPHDGARGVARIRYVVEDAAFKRHTNFITFVFPLVDVISPKQNIVSMRAGDSLELKAQTYVQSIAPLSGELNINWRVTKSPTSAEYAISGGDLEDAVFTALTPGKYLISLTARDGEYSTQRMLTVIVKASETAASPFMSSLFGHWPLDKISGGSILDVSGNNNTIYHRNVDVFVDGVRNQASRLNGSNEYLRLTTLVDALKAMGEGSISLWFKTTEADKQIIFSASDLIDGTQNYQIYLNRGEVYIERKESQGNMDLIHFSEDRLDDGEWHHLLLTAEISGLTTLYIDGNPVVKQSMSFIKGLYSIDEANFGVSRNGNSTSDYFRGAFDELKIFKEALAPSEVSALLGQDLPDAGTISGLSNLLVLPVGVYDPTDFGVFYLDENNEKQDGIGQWLQIRGPEDIDTDMINWEFNVPGTYIFKFIAKLNTQSLSKELELQVIDKPSLNFGWVQPQLKVFNQEGGILRLDLSNSIRDIKSLGVPTDMEWQFVIHEVPDNYKNRVGISDGHVLEIDVIPGVTQDLEVYVGVHDGPEVLLPVKIGFERNTTPYQDISLTIPETLAPATVLANLKQLLGINESAAYSIINGNELDLFALNTLSGELSLKSERYLNYERNTKHFLQIQVATLDKTGSLTVQIAVSDINEPIYVPDQIFQLNISESNNEIGTLQYSDPENFSPEFRILESEYSDLFTVSNPGGAISSLNKDSLLALDEEMLLLQMEAVDSNSGGSSIENFSLAVLLPGKVVDGNSMRKVKVPENGLEKLNWTNIRFLDASWKEGKGGVGYERNSGYERWIYTDLESSMYNENASVYIRIPFNVTDPDIVKSLDLRMFYDDGFIAYINGKIVASSNSPSISAWNSSATRSHPDSRALVGQDYPIEVSTDLLEKGENILAIHGLNSSVSSSDMLIFPELFMTELDNDALGFPQVSRIVKIEQNGYGRANLSIELPGISDETELTLFFGKTPAGGNEKLWENSQSLGSVTNHKIERSIAGLGHGQIWFFKILSKSSNGNYWSRTESLFLKNEDDIVLVDPFDSLKYIIPENSADLIGWNDSDFEDTQWRQGFSGIGYESSSGYEPFINTSVLDQMRNKTASALIRFNIHKPNNATIENVAFEMMYDDGFVAYLNGKVLASANVRNLNSLGWNSRSSASNSDRSAVSFETFDISSDQLLFNKEQNVFSIHGLNSSPTSSDFLIRPRMTGIISLSGQVVLPMNVDNDALPDDWELENFGSLKFNGYQDNDSDGKNNFEAYVASLSQDSKNPNDGSDFINLSISYMAEDNSLWLYGLQSVTGIDVFSRIQVSNNLETWGAINPSAIDLVNRDGADIIAIDLDDLSFNDSEIQSELFFRLIPLNE